MELKKSIVKIDENSGVKCILLEILRLSNKTGDANILNDFHGECSNNDLKCRFRKEYKCTCTTYEVKNILDQLTEMGILRKVGQTYSYDSLGVTR